MERSVKAQFKYADKIGAEYVAVIGGNELAAGEMNVKRMADSTSEKVPFAKAAEYFFRKMRQPAVVRMQIKKCPPPSGDKRRKLW